MGAQPRQMKAPSSIANLSAPLVADASSVVNLQATSCAAEILRALPNQLVIVDEAATEIRNGYERGYPGKESMQKLVQGGLIQHRSLGPRGLEILESLVVGSAAETLDDGEAATIAYALENGAIPIIDEHKATRICEVRFDKLVVASTMDLFAHPAVQRSIGRLELQRAVFDALQVARMRPPNHYLDWTVELVGKEKAALCPSLPRRARER